MGVLTGTGAIAPPVTAAFQRELLRVANPKLLHSIPATKKSLSQRSGDTMKFRRISKLPLAMTPLLEGQPPAGKQLAKEDISCTIQQWGDYIAVSDLVEAIVQHPTLREATRRLGEQAGETLDALARDIWVAGTSVFYGGGVASRSLIVGASQKIDGPLIERAQRYLGQQNASPFTPMVDADSGNGTFPTRDAFYGICGPEVKFTLQNLPGFISIEEYAGQTRVQKGEFGAFKNVRFCETTLAKKYLGGGGATDSSDAQYTSSVADVHVVLIFGRDAVAEVPLDGMSMENIIKPLGSAGAADPLNQIATTGWKHAGARVRLNEAFMTRLEVAVADVTP